MNLIIVESPTKARTLGRFLGSDYDVEATMGHVKDLPKSKLGVDVEHDFKPEFMEVAKRADTIEKLKAKSKKSKVIFLASDPDREGEAIAFHVKELLDGKNTKRIVFHEITKEAVEEAIKNPHDIDKNLVDAQTARRVLDRLVGYKLSPLLWRKVRRGLSAGRVQSVAVRLIVEKEREIEKFKTEEYWEIFSQVETASPAGVLSRNSPKAIPPANKHGAPSSGLPIARHPSFIVSLVKIGEKTAEVKDKKTADEIVEDLKGAKYEVFDIKKRDVVKNPYPPYTTSTMQMAGARVLGWSSKKTMSVAQKLYEEGLITYHRTDSLNMNGKAVDKARVLIGKEYGEKYLSEKARFYKTQSKVAQEAHEAIRPTDVAMMPANVSGEMEHDFARLYDLIWRRFVATQMAQAVYSETAIDVTADKYLLRAGGQVMTFDGWRKLFKKDVDFIELPDIEKGEKLSLIKTWGEQKFTLPPARFNEASLIKMLEKLGIGRPSTYAPTISTIQVRGYVEKNESKQFTPTAVGIAVNDFLIANFPQVFDYDFTAGMENDLDAIANGVHPWEKTIKEFYGPFDKKLEDVTKNSKRVKIAVEKLGKKCPECKKGELVIRTGRFGKFISCSRFPDCKYTAKYLEKVGVKCPECGKGDVIIKKTGKGRKFFGCSRYPDCKYASWRSPKKEEAVVN